MNASKSVGTGKYVKETQPVKDDIARGQPREVKVFEITGNFRIPIEAPVHVWVLWEYLLVLSFCF